MLRTTYTYVELELSQSAYEEIKRKLLAADYGHCIDSNGTIDMHGLAVIREKEKMETCDFGWALRKLLSGERVCRSGWNGPGMWIAIQYPDANSKMGRPYIYIKSVDGLLVPWVPSQTDVLATDWEVVSVNAPL